MVFCFTVFAALASHSGSVSTAGAEARLTAEAITVSTATIDVQPDVAALFPCELSDADVEVEDTDDDRTAPEAVPSAISPVAAFSRAVDCTWATQSDEALRVAVSTGLCRGPPSLG